MQHLERYKKIFGEDFACPQKKMVWQLRTNEIKITANDLEKRLREKYGKLEKKDWANAFLVESGENLANSLEHVLGLFFLQNLSSMMPPLVLEPNENDRILDMAASPGAKTTQIATMMENKGVIVANDIGNDRLKALRGNLQRCGVANAIVTETDGRFFKTDLAFDKILLDVPCTGTGTLSPRILKTTSENTIRKFSNLQKQLLASATRHLKKDGILVYSTCSLEPEENEENVDFAIRKLGLVAEQLKLPELKSRGVIVDWDGKKFDENVSNAARIIPDGIFEGFFVCKLRKY